LKFLSIPASSAPAERVFSLAGNVITEKRNRLGPTSIEFLHSGYSRTLLSFYTPVTLGGYQVSTLRILSETTRILHSGCSQSLRGFYTPDILGIYWVSILQILSETTRFLHSGYSRRLLGFYQRTSRVSLFGTRITLISLKCLAHSQTTRIE